MAEFDSLLEESVRVHGHLCAGQVLGVRMTMLGLREIGITDPKGRERKDLIVFIEMDRCATDAVQSVTGCSLGKRSMKFMDYGKMAATFLNVKTGRAVRVLAREEARERAKAYFPDEQNPYSAQLRAYRVMGDEELFEVKPVRVEVRPEDLPGRPLGRVKCEGCGEYVQDLREVRINGRAYCKPCAQGGYYRGVDSFLSPTVMQSGHSGMEVRSKLWIEVEGEPVFGRGRRFLLHAIEAHGSINQAAKEINISYRKAWSYIKSMEERLGIRLVERQAGGKNGGGATLTEEAREFLKRYEMVEEDIRKSADLKFREIFPKTTER